MLLNGQSMFYPYMYDSKRPLETMMSGPAH